MTPEELAFSVIRNQISLENLSRELARKATPQLREVYRQLQELIRSFPEEKIARDLRYRLLEGRLAALLQGPNDALYRGLVAGLSEAAPEQLEQAAKTLGVGVQPAAGVGPVGQGVGGIAPAQVAALTDDTRVLGKKLTTLFGWEDVTDSPFIKTQIKRIDRVVKQGFLLGETNDEIARNLVMASRGSIRDAQAIARTAVMDMSQRAHDRVYAANRDRIALYRFDATFDFRVCMECAPLDGKESPNRSDLPDTPIHPNCRCRIVAITNTQLALEKEDRQQQQEMSIVDITKGGKPVGRVYKTKAKVDGEKFTKFAHEVKVPAGQKPSMGLFLQRATHDTRVSVLGQERAKWFEDRVLKQGTRTKSADDALREAVKMDFSRRK